MNIAYLVQQQSLRSILQELENELVAMESLADDMGDDDEAEAIADITAHIYDAKVIANDEEL